MVAKLGERVVSLFSKIYKLFSVLIQFHTHIHHIHAYVMSTV